jgi:hypothetical protein
MSFASQCARIRREYGRPDASEAAVTIAADFLTGAAPSFARAFDRRGEEIMAIDRAEDEPIEAFRARALQEAAGASRVVLGGLKPCRRGGGRQRAS